MKSEILLLVLIVAGVSAYGDSSDDPPKPSFNPAYGMPQQSRPQQSFNPAYGMPQQSRPQQSFNPAYGMPQQSRPQQSGQSQQSYGQSQQMGSLQQSQQSAPPQLVPVSSGPSYGQSNGGQNGSPLSYSVPASSYKK